jgi:hypothetical protein
VVLCLMDADACQDVPDPVLPPPVPQVKRFNHDVLRVQLATDGHRWPSADPHVPRTGTLLARPQQVFDLLQGHAYVDLVIFSRVTPFRGFASSCFRAWALASYSALAWAAFASCSCLTCTSRFLAAGLA